jgi:hypothetical protein
VRFLCASILLCAATVAQADGLSDEEILGQDTAIHVDSVRARFSHFDQTGHGYQSQADRPSVKSPRSEEITVEQPQVEILAHQGKKFTHRLWVPLDVITAASPDALDAISTASRVNEAGSIDLTSTYHYSKVGDVFLRAAFHLEEPFRSWLLGVGGTRSFADDNTVVAYSVNQVFDWLDRFNIFGTRLGRAFRSSTNGNISITQLLSPTTIGHLNYGVTVQLGELSNTWNAVPLSTGELGREYLPNLRHRHAFVGRLAQALPWHGAVKGFYRFYVDNWGILAHTFELQLYQHITRYAYLRANYRYHTQTAADFWTTNAKPAEGAIRTADSDLAAFTAQTFGVLAAVDLPMVPRLRELHIDFGYEYYVRTNDLRASIYTCSLGFRF